MTKHPKSPNTPTKLLWLTDLHLDLATGADRSSLLGEITSREYDAAVITGDIASASSICDHLKSLAASCHPKPVYFVLGNHDFYGGKMAHTYEQVSRLCQRIPNLIHLQDAGPIVLGRNTVLIGHHGWADARSGWGSKSAIENPDHWNIPDFRKLTREERFRKMELLGNEAASAIRTRVLAAFRNYRNVVIATHVPPFPTTAKYDGRTCGKSHLPHFANVTVGAMLIGLAKQYCRKHITVISGHTHSKFEQRILLNLDAHVGGARKGKPEIQERLDF